MINPAGGIGLPTGIFENDVRVKSVNANIGCYGG
jgi:hypothetical protein